MLRPPSNQKTYKLFFSADPAIVQIANDATKERQTEHERLLRVARETGDWSAITVPGEQPTTFSMRQLPSESTGELANMQALGEPQFRVLSLAFRSALVDAAPLIDGVKVAHDQHPIFGRIATTTFLDEIGCGGNMGAALIVELGRLVLERSRATNPF